MPATATIAEVQRAYDEFRSAFLAAAGRLSAERRRIATGFARALERLLAELAMEQTRVDVRFDALSFLLQIEQHVELLGVRLDRFRAGDALLDARALAPYVLCFGGIVPETGNRDLALDLLERFSRGREVKDSSGRCAVGSGGRRS